MDEIRVSIYIVTYRNRDDLNNNIASILESGAPARIYVINNHSQFFIEPKHEAAVTVLHNTLRPDFSTGHLARNWNQALLHGFKDLNNPASDIVVTVQDDVIFKPNWFRDLIDLHRRYNFITMGMGDCFCSYLPEAVKKVGMWDERFCSIAFQEADYFLRSIIYNRDHCSINDIEIKHNAVEGNVFHVAPVDSRGGQERVDSMLINSPHWNRDRRSAHAPSMQHSGLQQTFFEHKWGISAYPWTAKYYTVRKSLIKNYIVYPYFEKDVEGLHEKNYLLAEEKHQSFWENLAQRLVKINE